MYIDSHCHLDFPQLRERLPQILARMDDNAVAEALCVSVNLDAWPELMALVESEPRLWASVGVHPDYEDVAEPTVQDLVERVRRHDRIVAIGETGLDYYRLEGDLEWQRERFRVHIRAARETGLPLIIHTRSASEDTLRIMAEEGAAEVGGVMHCFTESQAVADAAIAMNFMISLSGIVTFKNAKDLHALAANLPLDSLLIETDSPYLAPVPFRGKTNEPGFVRHVAEHIATLRGCTPEDIGKATSANFRRLFARAVRA